MIGAAGAIQGVGVGRTAHDWRHRQLGDQVRRLPHGRGAVFEANFLDAIGLAREKVNDGRPVGAAGHMQQQCVATGFALRAHISRGNARLEDEHIDIAGVGARFHEMVPAIATPEDIGVAAAAAGQVIVPRATVQRVIARVGIQPVVAGQALQRIGSARARERFARCRARDAGGHLLEVRRRPHGGGAVLEAHSFKLPA